MERNETGKKKKNQRLGKVIILRRTGTVKCLEINYPYVSLYVQVQVLTLNVTDFLTYIQAPLHQPTRIFFFSNCEVHIDSPGNRSQRGGGRACF